MTILINEEASILIVKWNSQRTPLVNGNFSTIILADEDNEIVKKKEITLVVEERAKRPYSLRMQKQKILILAVSMLVVGETPNFNRKKKYLPANRRK